MMLLNANAINTYWYLQKQKNLGLDLRTFTGRILFITLTSLWLLGYALTKGKNTDTTRRKYNQTGAHGQDKCVLAEQNISLLNHIFEIFNPFSTFLLVIPTTIVKFLQHYMTFFISNSQIIAKFHTLLHDSFMQRFHLSKKLKKNSVC